MKKYLERFIAWLMEVFGKQDVTKLKIKWAAHQLIFGGMAYEWWKMRRGDVAEICEFLAANGWTGVSLELAGEIAWWPKDRMQVADIQKYLREAIDDLAPWVEETRKRNLILKIIMWNSNIDQGRKLKPGYLEAAIDYLVKKYDTKGFLILPVSERDRDLDEGLRTHFISYVERIFPKEQTVAYAQGRGDAAFTEHHPSSFAAKPSGSGWSTLIVSDNGGTLREMHEDGVTGHAIKENVADLFKRWIGWGYSVELYAFWPSIRGKESKLKAIGSEFVRLHGSRK